MGRRIRLIEVRCTRRRSQRPRKEQRNCRNQLKHMLSRHTLLARLGSLRVHHPVYPGFLRNDLIPRSFRDGLGVIRAPTIPDASHVVARDDLNEAAGLDVSDLDESAVEEENVGRMPGNSLCRAFPLDRTYATAWVSVFVDVQSELCGKRLVRSTPRPPAKTYHRSRAGTRPCST